MDDPNQARADGLDYAELKRDVERSDFDTDELARRLSDGWAASYQAGTRGPHELVEIDQGSLTYLFDIANQRVVGVYGHSDATKRPYPAGRMRGFPLPGSRRGLIRGHLAAHSIGGGTDTTLIPQDQALNISRRWRRLERRAQANPGSFVAVEVTYDDEGQTPMAFVYLVVADGRVEYERFEN